MSTSKVWVSLAITLQSAPPSPCTLQFVLDGVFFTVVTVESRYCGRKKDIVPLAQDQTFRGLVLKEFDVVNRHCRVFLSRGKEMSCKFGENLTKNYFCVYHF